MWVITLKADVMYIHFSIDNHNHSVLPVFTSPDAAVTFSGDLEYEGERIQLTRINSLSKIDDLKNLLGRGDIELVVLDPPNLDAEDHKLDMTHWDTEEFLRLLESLTKISEKYDERKAIDTLDTYIHAIQDGEAPPGIDVE